MGGNRRVCGFRQGEVESTVLFYSYIDIRGGEVYENQDTNYLQPLFFYKDHMIMRMVYSHVNSISTPLKHY